MSSEEQREADCKYLSEALSVGPARYSQMTDGIYEIYERWHFDPQTETPVSVLEALQGGRCFFCSQFECGNKCVTEYVE